MPSSPKTHSWVFINTNLVVVMALGILADPIVRTIEGVDLTPVHSGEKSGGKEQEHQLLFGQPPTTLLLLQE